MSIADDIEYAVVKKYARGMYVGISLSEWECVNNIAFAVETEEEAVDKLCEYFEYESDEDFCGCDNGLKTCLSSADRWACIKKNKRINTKFVDSRAECYKLAHFDDLPHTKIAGAMPSAVCDLIAEYVSIRGYLICRADFEFLYGETKTAS